MWDTKGSPSCEASDPVKDSVKALFKLIVKSSTVTVLAKRLTDTHNIASKLSDKYLLWY